VATRHWPLSEPRFWSTTRGRTRRQRLRQRLWAQRILKGLTNPRVHLRALWLRSVDRGPVVYFDSFFSFLKSRHGHYALPLLSSFHSLTWTTLFIASARSRSRGSSEHPRACTGVTPVHVSDSESSGYRFRKTNNYARDVYELQLGEERDLS